MTPADVFRMGLEFHHYANTAYPLTPSSFRDFRIVDKSSIPEFLQQEWDKAERVNLYIHIPFCQSRCRFCEYAVLENTDHHTETEYVDLLLKEMAMYAPLLKDKKIVGYDLGGGTPTKLSTELIARITTALYEHFDIEENVTFSIETTPAIAAHQPEKIQAIYDLGYRRISMGVQTISHRLLNSLGREGSVAVYEKAMNHMRSAGYQSINIDLMYGFLNQSDDAFETTLRYAIGLKPDHITLYRNRYKGTKIEGEAGGVSLYQASSQYRLAHNILNEQGYIANVGKNTFSRIEGDYGTSDYLTKRVIEGVSYIGLGLGAQSFGDAYLAYNLGAATKQLKAYQHAIEKGRFPIQDIYALPKEEAIAKMVSVAFYFAFIDLDAFRQRFDEDFERYFADELAFCRSERLMERRDKRYYLTERGADYINGVIALFYSPRSQQEMQRLMQKRGDTHAADEALFLNAYHLEDYRRPSLATDIVLLRRGATQPEVLLIRRGAHPFMNQWALPGGFVLPGESADETAVRELKEETGITNVSLAQLRLFSRPDRDPRGWIVSAAYTGICENTMPVFGDDAVDAGWFQLACHQVGDQWQLTLTRDGVGISATVTAEGEHLQIDADGLAFDHGSIIACAYEKIKN